MSRYWFEEHKAQELVDRGRPDSRYMGDVFKYEAAGRTLKIKADRESTTGK